MKQILETPISHKDVWNFRHCGMAVEIIHHSVGELVNNGKGIWCYYVYVREDQCRNGCFEKLWLEDKAYRVAPHCPERITHDYCGLFSECEWHGGVTFYDKHGHTPGHRGIQIGCDFSHLWDEERAFDYTLEDVEREARRTAELVAAELKGSGTAVNAPPGHA